MNDKGRERYAHVKSKEMRKKEQEMKAKSEMYQQKCARPYGVTSQKPDGIDQRSAFLKALGGKSPDPTINIPGC
jgi:hypothetical protein